MTTAIATLEVSQDGFVAVTEFGGTNSTTTDETTSESTTAGGASNPEFVVDFYQNITDTRAGWPDPQTNVPPGSITFDADGTIIHEPFTK